MSRIALTRGQFLLPFTHILDNLGAPTEALLEKHKLPSNAEMGVNDYVPIKNAIRFGEAASRSQGIPDFGHMVAREACFNDLSERMRTLILSSPSLFLGLKTLCAYAHLEDTNLRMFLAQEGESIRLHSTLIGVKGFRHLEHSQWLQNVLPIQVVREFVGPGWSPSVIAFEADYIPGAAAQEHWSASRFLPAQPYSWINIPVKYMSLPPIRKSTQEIPLGTGAANISGELVDSLKLMLPSYFSENIPSVNDVAEMAHMSVRNFQRILSESGLSYRDVLNVVRYEKAVALLNDPDIKITDIARSLGYQDGAHFTRAFRRMAGIAPMQFRKSKRT